jgi:hypothetical protein
VWEYTPVIPATPEVEIGLWIEVWAKVSEILFQKQASNGGVLIPATREMEVGGSQFEANQEQKHATLAKKQIKNKQKGLGTWFKL